jgi:hypothetical protein
MHIYTQTEVFFLGQLRHPHLVKLIGYCYEDEHRLLVYEFMTRGSLEKHLFKSKHPPSFDFSSYRNFSFSSCHGMSCPFRMAASKVCENKT